MVRSPERVTASTVSTVSDETASTPPGQQPKRGTPGAPIRKTKSRQPRGKRSPSPALAAAIEEMRRGLEE